MTILFFTTSLVVICVMLASRVFQIKVRQIHFLSHMFARGDSVIQGWIEKGFGKYNLYRKIARLFIFDFLPSYLYEQVVKIKDYIAKKYYGMGDEFRGRRILRTTGSVSFFLKRLAEDRMKN